MPVTLACSCCDGPVSGRELADGLAMRVDGNLVCALCIDTLPPEIQAGIERTRRARGLSPILRFYEHPARRGYRIYGFSDSAALGQHRRSMRAGQTLAVVPYLKAPSRQPRWLPWLAVGGGAATVAGVLCLVIFGHPSPPAETPAPVAIPTVPKSSPVTAPAAAPIDVPDVPIPRTLPVQAPPVPENPQVVVPVQVPVPTPVVVVPTPAKIAPSIPIPLPPAPASVAPPAIPPEPAPVEPPVATETVKIVPITVSEMLSGGRPAVVTTPRSNERPPLPWPILPEPGARLIAALDDPSPGPWKGRKALRFTLPAAPSRPGGLVLALHGGRLDRKELEVFRLEAGGKVIRTGSVSIGPQWSAIVVEDAIGGTIVLADASNRITTPFWCAGGVSVMGRAPVTRDFTLHATPLVLGDATDRRLRELIDTATKARGGPIDPLKFQVGLDDEFVPEADFKKWQTNARQELHDVFEGRVPNGTFFQTSLLPLRGETILPDHDRCHLFLFGLEGHDNALPKGSLGPRITALRKQLLLREPKGSPGGIIGIPIVGNALATATPSGEWASVIDTLKRSSDPWIDLRGVPAEATAPTLSSAIANLVFHLQWLQNRPK